MSHRVHMFHTTSCTVSIFAPSILQLVLRVHRRHLSVYGFELHVLAFRHSRGTDSLRESEDSSEPINKRYEGMLMDNWNDEL